MVHLACDFKLQNRLNERLNPLPVLVSSGKVDLAVHFVQGHSDLAAQLIPLLSTNQHVKTAGKLIESHKLDPFSFPTVLTRMKKIAVRYFVNSQTDLQPRQMVELMDGDPELLEILVEEMEYRSRDNRGLVGVLADVVREYPWVESRLKRETVETIKKGGFGEGSLTGLDVFSPKDSDALQYPLPRSSIHFIDSESCIPTMNLNSDILGFDCEWRPALIKFTQYPVSIFQIATRTDVYILDLIALNGSKELNTLLSTVFLDSNIVKVGLSFAEDRRLLIKSYPEVSAFEGAIMSYGDLQRMYQETFPEEMGSGGLVMLVQRFLKKKLCKGEQKSNWMKRPLRERQLHYAALDAYVEILIWDRLVEEARDKGEDVRLLLSSLGAPDEEQQHSSGPKCKACGQTGHKAKDCSKCFRCHQAGHKATECPG